MKMSKRQAEIMWALDNHHVVDLPGTSMPAVKVLAEHGLVTYRRVHSIARTFYVSSSRSRVEVRLTNKGADYIFNGGLDHGNPVLDKMPSV